MAQQKETREPATRGEEITEKVMQAFTRLTREEKLKALQMCHALAAGDEKTVERLWKEAGKNERDYYTGSNADTGATL